MDRYEIPKFVHGVLSLRPKHTVRDKFNQVHFLADVDKSVLKLRNKKGSFRTFVKMRRPQTGLEKAPMGKGVIKLHDYLKTKGLLGVQFDKSCACALCVTQEVNVQKKI